MSRTDLQRVQTKLFARLLVGALLAGVLCPLLGALPAFCQPPASRASNPFIEGAPYGEPSPQTVGLMAAVEAALNQGSIPAAKRQAREIRELVWRDIALGMVILFQCQQQDFVSAKQTVRGMHFPLQRVNQLISIARFERIHGKVTQANRTLEDALRIALTIRHLPTRDRGFTLMAVALLDSNYMPEAKKLADAITDDQARASTLARIARRYAELGKLPPAHRLLPRARREVGGMPEGYARDMALRDIFFVETKAGDHAGGLNTARLMHVPASKTNALAEVAALQAQAGSPLAARRTVEEAKTAFVFIQDSYAKDYARYLMVLALVATGDRTGAKHIASEIVDRDFKEKAGRELSRKAG